MSPHAADTLADIITRAREAHTDRVVVPVETLETECSERQAAQDRRRAQSDAARATNSARLEKSRAAVVRALGAVLLSDPLMPRHRLVTAVFNWLDENWRQFSKQRYSRNTVLKWVNELQPRGREWR